MIKNRDELKAELTHLVSQNRKLISHHVSEGNGKAARELKGKLEGLEEALGLVVEWEKFEQQQAYDDYVRDNKGGYSQ